MARIHFFIFAILLLGPRAAVAAPAASAPNIILILADDLGINDLNRYGRREHPTPHLDALAGDGIRFTTAYCAQPICSPSRAAILTGKTPARLQLTTYLPGRPDTRAQRVLHPTMRQQLPLAEQTLAEILRTAGYRTACIGKWHLGGKGYGPEQQGFDVVFPGRATTTPSNEEGGKGEFALTTEAMRFMRANTGRRFLLFLAHNNPHIPLAAQRALIDKHQAAFNPIYAAVIETLDRSVGQLLRTVDELGLRQNTIVVFTSDNGGLHVPEGRDTPATHNTPFRAGKGFLYEGGLRVPLMVRWPAKIRAGREIATPVINTDLTPTLLELAGVPAPKRLDGRSFARLLTAEGDARRARRAFYWHFPHYTNQGGRPGGAVREGDWKLIEYYDNDRLELFNLARDPGEANNLALLEPRRADALQRKLRDWRKTVGAQENQPNPQFDAEMYRRLYVDTDVTRLKPRATAAEMWSALQDWRAAMDEAVRRR